MKKGIKTKKLSRTSNERKQLFRNLIKQIVDKGAIETSLVKAKTIRPQLEKLVTLAKDKSLNSLRHLVAETGDMKTANKLFDYGKLFRSRNGGYVKILRVDSQKGDNAEVARLEFVEKIVTPIEIKSEPKPTKVPETKPVETKTKVNALSKKTKTKKIK